MNAFPAILPNQPDELEAVIAVHEKVAAPLKQGAEASIIWHDEHQKNKTPYSIVYLHGFKGSRDEGYPVHQNVAKELGCNLYLARLYGHGLKREQNFKNLSYNRLIESAFDACRIGQKIGRHVIIMGTSTGASLALHAAASNESPVTVNALVLYSPLIHLYGIQSLLLENNVMRSLLRLCPGKDYLLTSKGFSPDEEAVWYSSYLLNGALALGKTIQKIMRPSLFAKVTCPVFTGYYYKNKHEHDRVVSTSAIKRMMQQLGTPPENRSLVNFPHAGTHVLASSLLSNAVQDVTQKTKEFLVEIIN